MQFALGRKQTTARQGANSQTSATAMPNAQQAAISSPMVQQPGEGDVDALKAQIDAENRATVLELPPEKVRKSCSGKNNLQRTHACSMS